MTRAGRRGGRKINCLSRPKGKKTTAGKQGAKPSEADAAGKKEGEKKRKLKKKKNDKEKKANSPLVRVHRTSKNLEDAIRSLLLSVPHPEPGCHIRREIPLSPQENYWGEPS